MELCPSGLIEPDILVKTVEMIAQCNQVDLLIIHIAFDDWSLMNKKDTVAPFVESLHGSKNTINKPAVVVLHSHSTDEAKQLASEAHIKLLNAGFPVYQSFRRAANIIDKFIQYHQWHQIIPGNDSDG